MDEKLLKHMAASSFALMLMVILMSLVISHYDQTLTYAGSSGLDGNSSAQKQNGENTNLLSAESGKAEDTGNEGISDSSIRQRLGDRYIMIKKPEKRYYNVSLEDLYMDRSIRLTITGLKEKVFNGTSIVRVNQGYEFTGIPNHKPEEAGKMSKVFKIRPGQETESYHTILNKGFEGEKLLIPEVISAAGEVSDYGIAFPQGISDPAKDFSIKYKQKEAADLYTAAINIALDFIYAPVLCQDEDYIYIDLRRPKDVYDKIVVIDAGHGGKDCGTFSQDGQYYEKDMNLSVVLKLKEILAGEDFKVYYTRAEDKTLYLNPRVNFANDVEADLFFSIHCNSNESAIPGGSEVLYNEKQQGGGFGSKRLAQIALEEITNVTHRINRGLVPGSEMVIVGKSKVPMALIEVAFMSNREDLDFLGKEENKSNIAEAVHKIILRSFDELGK